MYRRFLPGMAVFGLLVAAMSCASAVAQQTETEPKKIREPDVVFVPTPHDVVAKMLELTDVKKTDVVYDLGCGDGRIVVAAAKKGCKAFGFDIDPQRIKDSRANINKNVQKLFREAEAAVDAGDWTVARQKASQASTFLALTTIKQEDIFTLDLSEANVITLYLLPRLNVKLIPQLEKLKPGSRIVSHDFDMEGVKPDKVVEFTSKEDGSHHTIYFWTTPLKKEAKAGKDKDEDQ